MKIVRWFLVCVPGFSLILLTLIKQAPWSQESFIWAAQPAATTPRFQATNLGAVSAFKLPPLTLPQPEPAPELVLNLPFNRLSEPDHVFIPGFHDFGPGAKLKGMDYPEFEAYVQRIQALGYQNLTTQKLLDFLYGKEPLTGKWVLFTFDDGYGGQFEAAQILHRYGYTALLGIISNHVVTGGDKLNQAKIAELLTQGHELASHTSEHCALALPAGNYANFYATPTGGTWENCNPNVASLLNQNQVAFQLGDSKAVMEKTFGVAVRAIIYPYGYYNDITYQESLKAGYVLGFRFPSQVNQDIHSYSHTLELPRMRIMRGASL
ncbi:MAG: polysaccharide deacetylase family protein [Cyanobacteria bacterium P01_D01_bin.6]